MNKTFCDFCHKIVKEKFECTLTGGGYLIRNVDLCEDHFKQTRNYLDDLIKLTIKEE